MSIPEEVLESREEKVVVFSQWERMTRLVTQELDKLGVGYKSLHGAVPSAKRKELFDSFNNDDDCRVFVSTDAGGIGLYLQAGSLLINMDIPWNPAVLEQRIARVHRMDSMVETDKESGKTYMKIPVADTDTMNNALKALAALGS